MTIKKMITFAGDNG